MRIPRHVALGLVVAAASLSGCGTAGLQVRGAVPEHAAADLTAITGCDGRPLRAPSTLRVPCGARGARLTHLRWRDWGASQAVATGAATPAVCAAGSRCTVPVRVVATALQLGQLNAQYRALRVAIGRGAAATVHRYELDDRGPVTG